jgi:hypothetical protein
MGESGPNACPDGDRQSSERVSASGWLDATPMLSHEYQEVYERGEGGSIAKWYSR